ncbi:MAG: hypothetical protein ACR5LF_09815 [Symbiopectobacterium sp.]
MAFTKTVSVVRRKTIKQLSPALEIDLGEEKIELTYIQFEMHIFADGQASAVFKVSAGDDVMTGSTTYEFTYSGEGNPFTETETKLQAELSSATE